VIKASSTDGTFFTSRQLCSLGFGSELDAVSVSSPASVD